MRLSDMFRVVWAGLIVAVVAIAGDAPSAQAAPLLRLSFEDGTGSSTAADSSGNGLNGSLVNMNTSTAWVAGISGGGLAFDGSNDYLQVLDNALLDFGANDFAVSFWVNKRAATPAASFDNIWGVNKWNTGASPGSNEWSISLSQGGNDRASFGIASSSTSYFTPATTDLVLNSWEHLVGVRDNDVLKLYRNGVLATSLTLPGSLVVDNAAGRNLRIANSGQNANYADIIVDELQIYGNALTASEVGFLFNNPGLSTADIPPVPEPSSLVLLLGSLIMLKLKRKK